MLRSEIYNIKHIVVDDLNKVSVRNSRVSVRVRSIIIIEYQYQFERFEYQFVVRSSIATLIYIYIYILVKLVKYHIIFSIFFKLLEVKDFTIDI